MLVKENQGQTLSSDYYVSKGEGWRLHAAARDLHKILKENNVENFTAVGIDCIYVYYQNRHSKSFLNTLDPTHKGYEVRIIYNP